MTVNTQAYWTARFAGDWEAKHGREQTRFFARLALRELPPAVADDIRRNRLSICDFGCALGDALPILAEAFPASTVSGVDFAESAVSRAGELQPGYELLRAASMAESGRTFDVVYCSNTLEHFSNPLVPLRDLAAATRRYLIALVPFRESERIEEHLVTFDYGSFPLRVGPLHLLATRVIDAAREQPTHWAGKQILVVYGLPEVVDFSAALLADVTAGPEAERLADLEAARGHLALQGEELKARIGALAAEKTTLVAEKTTLVAEKTTLVAEKTTLASQLEEARAALEGIRRSNLWRAGSVYYKWRDRFRRLRKARRMRVRLGIVAKKALKLALGLARYSPYDRLEYLKPILVETWGDDRLAAASAPDVLPVSVVCTVYNEAATVERWLASLLRQSRAPAELVIVDGGSTDGTPELIEAEASRCQGLDVRLIRCAERVNIARGRNIGIEAARSDIVACTDCGTVLEEQWLERLTLPLVVDDAIDLTAGTYASTSGWAMSGFFVPDFSKVNPVNFLPSSRSVAFRKSLWRRCGGYPEWLQQTAEDTFFDLEARRRSRKWAFVPGARVLWRGPAGWREGLRLARRYSQGDGEAGLEWGGYRGYRRTARPGLRTLVTAAAFVAATLREKWRRWPLIAAQHRGYFEGKRGRVSSLLRVGRIRGNVLFLSGVPFHDSGGGQRGTRMALAFMRRRFLTTFVNVYPSYETQSKIFLDMDWDLLELATIDEFSVAEWARRCRDVLAGSIAVLEFPHPRFIPIARRLRRLGVRVVYDCIDDWGTSLGWIWYSEKAERTIIALSDALVASARALVERVGRMTDRLVHHLPQGVDAATFGARGGRPAPADLPAGSGPVLLYVGSLWGSWFDWELVHATSTAFPDARLVFLGEYGGQCPYAMPNAHFLGLKPHSELAGYLAAADVCLIPFKVDRITRAVNPLKVYEYLAMAKPVVASELPELEGMPYVLTSADAGAFVANVHAALGTRVDPHVVEAFVRENDWDCRIDSLLGWTVADSSGALAEVVR